MGNKGVVVEIAPQNKVIVMTGGGEFKEIPFKKHVHVGQEIRFSPRRQRLNLWQLGLAASLFLALVSSWPLLTSRLVPEVPAFVVTVDLNPSLELEINLAQRVLSAAGLNRDGRALLHHLDIVGHELSSALEKISRQAENEGYLKPGENHVFVTIAASNEGDARDAQYAQLEQVIQKAFSAPQFAQVRIWPVPLELQNEAKLAGITPGRYVVIQAPLQRLEAKLTMRDVEAAKVAEENSFALKASLKPALPKQATLEVRAPSIYNVGFPAVTQGKGDFRFYE